MDRCASNKIKAPGARASMTHPGKMRGTSPALWHLAPVLEWLSARAGYVIERHLLEISRMAMRINVAKEWRRLEAPVEERIRALVA
jgi:hypothetical protein